MATTLLTSATTFELQPTIDFLESAGRKINFSTYDLGGHRYQILITGIGPVFAMHSLTKFLQQNPVDNGIQIGIAGSFDLNISLGTCVRVGSERFGDIGVTQADGTFSDAFDLEWQSAHQYPFEKGALHWTHSNEWPHLSHLPIKDGVTISTVTGTHEQIDALKDKYPVDIETMETACFFYCFLSEFKPFIALRGISNFITERNKEDWRIDLAIQSTNDELIKALQNQA